MEKGAGPGAGPGCGVGTKVVGAGSVDTPGAGGTVVRGNLAEKRGSSGNRVGGGAIGGKGDGVQGSRPCTLTGVGYERRGVGTGVGGILVLGSSGRRNSELKKALGSNGPGQLVRA